MANKKKVGGRGYGSMLFIMEGVAKLVTVLIRRVHRRSAVAVSVGEVL